jgi:hypothetical protein
MSNSSTEIDILCDNIISTSSKMMSDIVEPSEILREDPKENSIVLETSSVEIEIIRDRADPNPEDELLAKSNIALNNVEGLLPKDNNNKVVERNDDICCSSDSGFDNNLCDIRNDDLDEVNNDDVKERNSLDEVPQIQEDIRRPSGIFHKKCSSTSEVRSYFSTARYST